MDVKKLYTAVKAVVRDNSLLISGSTRQAFEPVYDDLMRLFTALDPSLELVRIDQVLLEYEEAPDALKITTASSPCTITGEASFRILTFSQREMALVCDVEDRTLDSENKRILKHCRRILQLDDSGGSVTDTIEGILEFEQVSLPLKGVLSQYGDRPYVLREGTEIDTMDLLLAAFCATATPAFLANVATDRLQDVPAPEIIFEESDNEEGFVESDSFYIKVPTAFSIAPGDVLHVSDLCFIFEKFGSEYAVTLEGSVQVLKLKPAHFVARYAGGGFYTFGLSTVGEPEFGFSQMMELTGESPEGVFPREWQKNGKLTLSNLTLTTDLKGIQSFCIEVAYSESWVFCETPKLALSEIQCSFALMGEQKSYGIAGVVTLFGKDVRLSGSYTDGADWIFRGAMRPGQAIGLGEMMAELAKMYGADVFHLPLDVKLSNLRLTVGRAEGLTFSGAVFCRIGCEDTLRQLLNGRCAFLLHCHKEGEETIWSATIDGAVNIGGNPFALRYEKGDRHCLKAVFQAGGQADLSLSHLLSQFVGQEAAQELPEFLNLELEATELVYDFTEPEQTSLGITAELNELTVQVDLRFGKATDYRITLLMKKTIDLTRLPVVGGLFPGKAGDVAISAITLIVSKKEGVVFSCLIRGEKFCWTLSESKKTEKSLHRREGVSDAELEGTDFLDTQRAQAEASKIHWVNINQTLSVFALHRMGIAVEKGKLEFLLDASVSIAPLTMELMAAGIEAGLPKLLPLRFLLRGFGLSYTGGAVELSGAFLAEGESYQGEIVIQTGKASLIAMGEYENDSLTAYALLHTSLGGPPCFVVTGVAAAFGYHKQLQLPSIESVSAYPLVTAAMGTGNRNQLIKDLKQYISACPGQSFLAAGVTFTSFEIIDGVAMLTASFGNSTEIGLLGLAEMVMPPKSEKTPIARAELMLKAALIPEQGLLSCEARLSDRSYLLSEDCRLTGGFALYVWFDGIHRGDFVVTLGGYHPDWRKPDHYPDVKRLGFCWDVLPQKNRLVLSGELYCALTPSSMQAGGRLSAVYTEGNLKAWFIAYADFLMQWKPFHYDIRIGVSLGASYRVDFWFIHQTFSIELSAELHLWGPDFSGTAHITWYILSFTISFGEGSSQEDGLLDWTQFKESFLPAGKSGKENESGRFLPVSLQLSGQTGEEKESGRAIVRADDWSVAVQSIIPFQEMHVTGAGETGEETIITVSRQQLPVQPMGGTLRSSSLELKLVKGKREIPMTCSAIFGNVPKALWGKREERNEKGKSGELVTGVPVGADVSLIPFLPALFPATGELTEEALTEAQKVAVEDAFSPVATPEKKTWVHTDTISVFKDTFGRAQTAGAALLEAMGCGSRGAASRLAKDADNWLDDELLTGSVM